MNILGDNVPVVPVPIDRDGSFGWVSWNMLCCRMSLAEACGGSSSVRADLSVRAEENVGNASLHQSNHTLPTSLLLVF